MVELQEAEKPILAIIDTMQGNVHLPWTYYKMSLTRHGLILQKNGFKQQQFSALFTRVKSSSHTFI